MSLMGIVNWLKKKIIGERRGEPVGDAIDERKVKIDAEALGESLVAAIEKEKEMGVNARSLGESIKALAWSRERLKRLAWRRAANNDRRLRHKPMVRERAYIKAERNIRKRWRKREKVKLLKEGKRWK